MADIIDPYGKKNCIFLCSKIFHRKFLVYFARYQNTKILQFQAADDQFFLPDSEVRFIFSLNLDIKFVSGVFLG